jgi:hypothetical protein
MYYYKQFALALTEKFVSSVKIVQESVNARKNCHFLKLFSMFVLAIRSGGKIFEESHAFSRCRLIRLHHPPPQLA